MPIYAGESVKVFSSAVNWDDSPIGPEQSGVYLTVYNDQDVATVEDAPLDYVADTQRWECLWLETEPGTYRLVIDVYTSTGPGDEDFDVSREVKVVTLAPVRKSVRTTNLQYFVRGA